MAGAIGGHRGRIQGSDPGVGSRGRIRELDANRRRQRLDPTPGSDPWIRPRQSTSFSYRTSIGDVVPRQTPLLQGTLDLLILKALSLQPLHGLGVARRVEQITRGAFVVGPGSLFPALHRLEEQGWLESSWGDS